MKHSIKHDLDLATAKKVTEKAFDTYKAKFAEYNPTFSWASDSKADVAFKAKGITIAGSFTVLPTQIDFDLDVPFLLRPFQGKAVEIVDKEVQEWIQKAKNGQV
ncbi:MAG: hypothetical protein EOO75_02540 [Myxococcales bacterium]|nr:MAG: hypothetical protein EOO75_02540 [Myxococcales bacterium]